MEKDKRKVCGICTCNEEGTDCKCNHSMITKVMEPGEVCKCSNPEYASSFKCYVVEGNRQNVKKPKGGVKISVIPKPKAKASKKVNNESQKN
jgi:hypothetical protein